MFFDPFYPPISERIVVSAGDIMADEAADGKLIPRQSRVTALHGPPYHDTGFVSCRFAFRPGRIAQDEIS
jgi:hypothetical protein